MRTPPKAVTFKDKGADDNLGESRGNQDPAQRVGRFNHFRKRPRQGNSACPPRLKVVLVFQTLIDAIECRRAVTAVVVESVLRCRSGKGSNRGRRDPQSVFCQECRQYTLRSSIR